ncbi:MAG TPA: CBS domain-containing protein [Steroidobacteraceae bacterium]|nr:CBS domain-containing protein [Steroidobacteraceae bacterium]
MNVGDICQKNAITVRESDELTSAAKLMREEHVGYLVVVEPDLADGLLHASGVITDRDIVVSVVAREADAKALRVGDVMTPQPHTLSERDSVETAMQEMRRIGVRRMPVVGGSGELIGVLSLDDVLDVVARELQNLAGSVRIQRQIEGTLRP